MQNEPNWMQNIVIRSNEFTIEIEELFLALREIKK